MKVCSKAGDSDNRNEYLTAKLLKMVININNFIRHFLNSTTEVFYTLLVLMSSATGHMGESVYYHNLVYKFKIIVGKSKFKINSK